MFNAHYYPHPASRNVVYGKNGMVATSQPLAAQAGLEILQRGGNAIDAAVATAACLTVVEPTSNGIGGDAFALVYTKNELHGLNGSGPAPMQISIDTLKQQGHTEIPRFGFVPVTVPGAPKSWARLIERFGNLTLSQCLEPAIKYAKDGYPLSPTLAHGWKKAYLTYQKFLQGEEFSEWFKTFSPNGSVPNAGEMITLPHHARTLELIGQTNADSFYKGDIADQIDAFSKKYNGYIRKSDLETFDIEWVKPIKAHYKGYDVWEIPPNGQGLITLMALNILKNDTFNNQSDVETLHKQIEALKLAFTDGLAYITDPKEMKVLVEHLLSAEYGQQRRSLINEEALAPSPGIPSKGGTVYLATADGEGNMVSFIQSNYMGFGSGLVVPNTGIALQNRGHNFSFDETHDNALKPGKKPYHTIIPGFLTRDNEAIGPFGVMGGFMQPQGHLQVVMNTIDFHLNPQSALDAPRWQWIKDKYITVEQHMPNHLIKALADKGHQVKVEYDSSSFGRGQIIWRNPQTGVLCGGTESRTDGHIAAY